MKHAEQRLLETFQHHFARIWADRHEGDAERVAMSRRSLRDNVRGQRQIQARMAR